jgi:hypothetical protein
MSNKNKPMLNSLQQEYLATNDAFMHYDVFSGGSSQFWLLGYSSSVVFYFTRNLPRLYSALVRSSLP